MPKKIILCLDGTGNQVEENISNVLKLYRALKKNKSQIVYYNQGVGTIGREDSWGRLKQWFLEKLVSMGLGIGLDKKVIEAYEFLARTYEDGDQIFLFGYSRGAHTARVLAGMLYVIGLLRPEQINLSGAALTAYKKSEEENAEDFKVKTEEEYEGEGANFRRVMKPRIVSVHFMGLWDTVSSVMVPNHRNFFIPPIVRETLPHTSYNPAVLMIRHATSIDEKRRFFRLDRWPDGQKFKPNRFSTDEPPNQDHKQVWFAGYHGDVGGGNKRLDSGLSQFPLIWMMDEAKKSGLKYISTTMVNYVTGRKPNYANAKYQYPEPDIMAPVHPSASWWTFFEIFPKAKRLREWPEMRSFLGFYLPLKEPRFIGSDEVLAQSAKDKCAQDPSYKPVNWPEG